jgi:hypothetical protein
VHGLEQEARTARQVPSCEQEARTARQVPSCEQEARTARGARGFSLLFGPCIFYDLVPVPLSRSVRSVPPSPHAALDLTEVDSAREAMVFRNLHGLALDFESDLGYWFLYASAIVAPP